MALEEQTEDRAGGVLAGLLAPLRLPERVLETLDSLAEAARELGPMRSELVRVREQTEPLADLMPAVERLVEQTEPVPDLARAVAQVQAQAEPLGELLPALNSVKEELTKRLDNLQAVIVALEGDESHLNVTVRELVAEVGAMHKTVSGLQDDVERITDRLPAPGEQRGPLETARAVLTGSAG
jgi:ABC-type transporter Mla subunit MlaD